MAVLADLFTNLGYVFFGGAIGAVLGVVVGRAARRPSYEDGKLRDTSIKETQDPDFQRRDLEGVIKRAMRVQKRDKSPPETS